MKSYQFGTDYYPEHWPRSLWRQDARMMRDMGIQVVRMAEFSWAKFEPEEGVFDFSDLDEAIGILAEQGIDVILGTPTAAPPAWLTERYPDVQPTDWQMRRRYFGSRHHECFSHPAYRQCVRAYVEAFAAHYGPDPRVVGWQVDNELGNSQGELCYCPHCEARFRVWLKAKYGDIAALNAAWGTAFWSQDYSDFSQIHAPRINAAWGENPSQSLDWKRFSSDNICDFHRMQADILRAHAPNKFITHNLMGFSSKPSYYDLGAQLDFASHDQYPAGHFLGRHDEFRGDVCAAELDFIRAVKQKPFWIMEQQSGITGWEVLGRTPKPGQIALWALQSVAHGADTIVFFRWRSCPMGTEQYWHGLLPHNSKPGRYYREAEAMMHQYAPLLREIAGAMPASRAAILRSYEQEWAFQIQPHHPQHRYVDHLLTYYKAFYRRNVPVDFLAPEADFTPYRVLIAPLQFLMTPELAEKFRVFVQEGGTLVLTWRSGVRGDTNLSLCEGDVPCLLSDLTGAIVEEYDCLRDTAGAVRWGNETYPSRHWADLLTLTTAEPVAEYAREFYAGSPAITRNRFGKGQVYYVGTTMDDALSDRFLQELMDTAGLEALMDTPAGVEAVHRVKDGRTYLFLLNHTEDPQALRVPEGFARWDGGAWDGSVPPLSVTVFVK